MKAWKRWYLTTRNTDERLRVPTTCSWFSSKLIKSTMNGVSSSFPIPTLSFGLFFNIYLYNNPTKGPTLPNRPKLESQISKITLNSATTQFMVFTVTSYSKLRVAITFLSVMQIFTSQRCECCIVSEQPIWLSWFRKIAFITKKLQHNITSNGE